jgi:chromate transporter
VSAPTLPGLFLRFSLFSLMAVGGATALIPEMHRQVVDLHGWMSGAEFASLFAIAQAAPGPNVIFVSLIGWKLAGLPGALVCTLGMCLPAALLAFTVGRLWDRFQHSPWRLAIERGLAPITIGLVLGSGALLIRATGTRWQLVLVAGISAALSYRSRRNPLLWLAGAALLGGLGALS